MKTNFLIVFAFLALCVPPVIAVLSNQVNTWLFFLISLLSAMAVNMCTVLLVRKMIPNLFFQYFFIILTLLSLAWFFIYHTLAVDTLNPYGGFHLPYDKRPLVFFGVWLMPTLATLLLLPVLRALDRNVSISHFHQRTETYAMRRAVVLIFFLLNVLYLFANLNIELPVLSYFGRVGHNTSLLFLFWVAYWGRRLGILFYLTMGIMITIAVFELLIGSRFGPMMTSLMLFLGFFFGSSKKTRLRLALLGILLFPLVIMAAGYLEKIRILIGRGGIEDVSAERIELIQKAIAKIDRVEGVLGKRESAFVSGVARNVNWVDVAVITTTNHEIPYRGERNLDTELNNIFSLAFFSSGSKRERIDEARLNLYDLGLGTGPARKYGFVVDRNTSVEWSILSDSFSRGGHWVYLLYLLMLYFGFAVMEMIIKVTNRNKAEQKLLICVFLDIALKSTSLPLYESIRAAILNALFYGALILLIRIFHVRKSL